MAAPAPIHPCISEGWFGEKETMWPGQKFSLKVKEVLHSEKTEFQDVLIFQSETYGRVFALDGVLQVTERDECAYQETIAHTPLFVHPDPKVVLVVGGGDGGVVREVTRHAGVEKIIMCDIDRRVVEIAKMYFADTTASAFTDPRVEVVYHDAAEYIKGHVAEYDVIIVDSSDPVGPAESLYTKSFYTNMSIGLKPGGVIATQGECQWLHLDLILHELSQARDLFPVSGYCYATVPTLPSGQQGFIIASNDPALDIKRANRAVPPAMQDALHYYSPQMHAASFVLPEFSRRFLEVKK